ncbi:MAG TPA: hypothetical protein VGH64_07580 [Puia sp.]|jgi:hypothetical protein
MVKITITGFDPKTWDLIFDGDGVQFTRGEREAKRKEVVKWHVNDDSSVFEILIYNKPSPPSPSTNIWEELPHLDALSKNWKGKVSKTAPNTVKWWYSIDWIDKDSNKHTYDPKIIVNTPLG